MEDVADFDKVRDNLVDILKEGFGQIESAGFDGDTKLQQDWDQYKNEIEAFFRNQAPDDPDFRKKLSEMTARFAQGKDLKKTEGDT